MRSRSWYHGTSTRHLPAIRESGLHDPYLTSEYDQAVYYAGVEAAEHGGDRVVLRVHADRAALRYDAAAMAEPIGRKPVELSRQPGRHDWQVSSRYVHSVRHDGTVPPRRIRSVDVLPADYPDRYGL